MYYLFYFYLIKKNKQLYRALEHFKMRKVLIMHCITHSKLTGVFPSFICHRICGFTSAQVFHQI